jgi:hypothetical protein
MFNCGITAVEHLTVLAGTLAILRSHGKIRLSLPGILVVSYCLARYLDRENITDWSDDLLEWHAPDFARRRPVVPPLPPG